MKIVQADHGHISGIGQIVSACIQAMRKNGIFQWDEFYPNREIISSDIRNRSMYVAECNQVCIAAVALDQKQEPAYRDIPWTGGEPALVVHRLCVDPDRQGKGIGSRLMDFAEDYARKNDYASIRLDAYTGNPDAIRLYERRGYRKAGQVYFPRRDQPFACYEKIFEAETPR